jgi:hypothetical protein
LTDAGPEVAEAHRALAVVVSPDQIVDYLPSLSRTVTGS